MPVEVIVAELGKATRRPEDGCSCRHVGMSDLRKRVSVAPVSPQVFIVGDGVGVNVLGIESRNCFLR